MALRRDRENESSPAYFAPLPDGKSRSGAFLAAIGVEFVLAILILMIPATTFREAQATPELAVLLFHSAPVAKPHILAPNIVPRRVPIEKPMPETPGLPVPRPEIVRRRFPVPELPPTRAASYTAAPIYPTREPLPPAIHTGVLASAVAHLTPHPTAHKVRTGGFGDPMGVPPTGGTSSAMTIDPVGSFSSPVGPGKAKDAGAQYGSREGIANAGFGDMVTASKARGSYREGKTTATAGFGNMVTSSSQTGSAGFGGGIRSGGFSNQAAVPAASPPAPQQARPTIQPLVILDKPEPVYTAEARARKIEGSVVLGVIFGANGRVDVLRVLQSLGFGLDQAAIAAAQRIRFQPERIDGKPVDARARLRIVFRLAY